MAVFDLLESYALDPAPQRLRDLQTAIMRDPRYDPLVQISGTVVPLRKDDRNQQVVATIRSWMPGVLFSPSAHGHLARALADLGDAEGAQVEGKFARLALESIAATGSGAREDPCSVLRVEDEYDILHASKQRSITQQQITDERGAFDVHTLEDGDEIWFRLLWLAPLEGASPGRTTV